MDYNSRVGDRTGVLARVSSTEGELAVRRALGRRRCERDADDLRRNSTLNRIPSTSRRIGREVQTLNPYLSEEVVGDSWDGRRARDSVCSSAHRLIQHSNPIETVHTFGQVDGANTKDTINATEAGGPAGDADALLGDDQPSTEGNSIGVLGSCENLMSVRRYPRNKVLDKNKSVPEKLPEPYETLFIEITRK